MRSDHIARSFLNRERSSEQKEIKANQFQFHINRLHVASKLKNLFVSSLCQERNSISVRESSPKKHQLEPKHENHRRIELETKKNFLQCKSIWVTANQTISFVCFLCDHAKDDTFRSTLSWLKLETTHSHINQQADAALHQSSLVINDCTKKRWRNENKAPRKTIGSSLPQLFN